MLCTEEFLSELDERSRPLFMPVTEAPLQGGGLLLGDDGVAVIRKNDNEDPVETKLFQAPSVNGRSRPVTSRPRTAAASTISHIASWLDPLAKGIEAPRRSTIPATPEPTAETRVALDRRPLFLVWADDLISRLPQALLEALDHLRGRQSLDGAR